MTKVKENLENLNHTQILVHVHIHASKCFHKPMLIILLVLALIKNGHCHLLAMDGKFQVYRNPGILLR